MMTFFFIRRPNKLKQKYCIMIRRPTAPAHEKSYHAHHETKLSQVSI